MPPRRTSSRRRVDRRSVDPTSRDQPGDHRVRVPHVTGPEFIAAPHRRRHLRDEIEHPLCGSFFVGQTRRAADGFVDVGDLSVAPAAYLVAKDPKSARPARPDGAFGDDAALFAVGVTDGRLLDDEPGRRDTDFERRVVQIARRSPRSARRNRLEHATVEANEMATGTEGQPAQVDRRRAPAGVGHGGERVGPPAIARL